MENLHKALTIDERYQLLKKNVDVENSSTLYSWRNTLSLLSEKTFNEMLEVKSYDKMIFSHAVNYNPSVEQIPIFSEHAKQSEWYRVFEAGMATLTENDDIKNKTFTYLLRPFLNYFKEKIQIVINKSGYKYFLGSDVISNIFDYLATELSSIAYKTMILEMNISKSNGELKGDTPEDRYISFISLYQNKKRLYSFFDKYIVLTRLLSTRTSFILNNVKALLDRIKCDQEELMQIFELQNFKLTNCQFGEGDTHAKGNTVTILTFNDTKKVVYKPKSLQINDVFNQFIKWLNEKEHHNYRQLKIIQSLLRDSYAYEEYISYKSCQSLADVQNFYHRVGQLMAIIQLLNGTDIHMENLIAHGEHPVIIDLETLIQQALPLEKDESVSNKLHEALFQHVTRTLFLPTVGIKLEKLDLSALNGREQDIDDTVLQVVNDGTDNARYDWKPLTLKASNNLPFFENEKSSVHYLDFKQEILNGFITIYELVIENKEEFLKSKLMERFDGLFVRVLLRDTNQYATILMHTEHPEMLTDMLDREKALENMWAYPFIDKTIIRKENEDMLVHDIPIFFNSTESLSLFNSEVDEIPFVYSENSFNRFKTSICNLDINELNRQLDIILLHLGDFSTSKRNELYNRVKNERLSYLKLSQKPLDIEKDTFLKEAIRIGDDIISCAFKEKDINWLMPYNFEKDKWSLIPLKPDFYNGLAGMYFFFEKLYEVTKEERFKNFSSKLLYQCYPENTFSFEMGLSGYPGYLLAFSHQDVTIDKEKKTIYKLLNRFLKEIDRIFTDATDVLEKTDIINGTASLLLATLRLYKKNSNSDRWLELALKITDQLIDKYSKMSLSDFSYGHGIGGIFYAVSKLNEVVQNKKYRDFIENIRQQILNHPEDYANNLHWCTGKIGTNTALYLTAKEEVEKTNIEKSIFKLIYQEQFLSNDTLCHGNTGLIDMLLTLGTKDSVHLANQIGRKVLVQKQLTNNYQLMDIPSYPDISLFTGLSGIGYQFLRLSQNKNMPSLLY
ncbi:type 2 lanthipeptide synthetase LanM family protein [Bacillus sp. H1a]|uniref:type 2 lanthipeptide synthetase LanM family protein n=1 Tax=Bacillus sp. H1a TaxID=1397276 RepID=UPI000468ADE5|nr:type 2 lanthipeptide synthetase LanM family protein [Bacillus sp. H1a]